MILMVFIGIYFLIRFILKIKTKILIREINDKIEINRNHETELNPDVGFIIGPNEFFSSIHRNFFNKYKNICREKNINNTLFKYIECDKNETLNISTFPDIIFENIDLETNIYIIYFWNEK